MRNFEKIILGLAILSLILKFFLLSGGGILCVLSLSTLSVFYFYLGFAYFNDLKFKEIFKSSSYNNISRKRIIGGLGAGITLAILMIGLLFKFMHWRGQSMDFVLGLILAIIIILTIIIKTKGQFDSYYKMIVKRLISIGLFSFVFFLIPNSSIIKAQFRHYPRYIKAYNAFQNNSNDTNLIYSLDKERARIFMSDKEFEYHYKEKK